MFFVLYEFLLNICRTRSPHFPPFFKNKIVLVKNRIHQEGVKDFHGEIFLSGGGNLGKSDID